MARRSCDYGPSECVMSVKEISLSAVSVYVLCVESNVWCMYVYEEQFSACT